MGKHYDFISSIPTTIEGQKAWIIDKARERVSGIKVCINALVNFKLCNDVGELYKMVNIVVDDTNYWGSKW